MRINKNVLKTINNTPTRLKIALESGTSERNVIRWINVNSKMLTCAAPMKVIKQVTGLTEDEILDRQIA